MIRSLYSGVAGLTTHQTRMDVIGNNIANVNTYGFKASRTTFRDIYYQTAIGAAAGRVSFGGNNASQVGYGVQLGSIDKDMSQSNGQSTHKVFDLMLDGDGMFMTATYSSLNLTSDSSSTTVRFTRMGKFGLDSFGNLATEPNVLVVGSRNSLAGLHTNGDMSSHYLDNVEMKDRDGDGMISSSDVTFRNVINMNELIQTAYNVFTDDFGYLYGYNWDALLGGDEEGDLAGFEVTDEESPIVYDLVLFGGTLEELEAAADAAEEAGGSRTEFLKQFVDVHDTLENLNKVPEDADDGVPIGAEYRYYCDMQGKEVYDATATAAKTPIEYAEQYAALVEARGEGDDAFTTANTQLGGLGALIGQLTYKEMDGVNISGDGIITVNYNGQMKDLARIEIAVFDNYDGLLEAGNTTFKDSVASGRCGIKKPSELAETSVVSGYLEASNVNLANEFSDMIVTQRGFQANARIITTSDSMLEELVNLKR